MSSKSFRRVTFTHDSDSLMKPHPTVRVTFNIHIEPNRLMVESTVENVSAPERKPLRRLFGSLADFCAALENPECRQCDECDCTYDSEHNWQHNPQYPDKEWICENCTEEEGEEEEEGTIECDICHCCFSYEHSWTNAYNKLVWGYGLEDLGSEWLMMCENCQDDEGLVLEFDRLADEQAIKHFRTIHREEFNHVLDDVIISIGKPSSKPRGMPLTQILKIQIASLKGSDFGDMFRSEMVKTSGKIERLEARLQKIYGKNSSIFLS